MSGEVEYETGTDAKSMGDKEAEKQSNYTWDAAGCWCRSGFLFAQSARCISISLLLLPLSSGRVPLVREVRWHPAETPIIPALRWMRTIGREGGIRWDNYGRYSWLCEKVGRQIKTLIRAAARRAVGKQTQRDVEQGWREGEDGKVKGSRHSDGIQIEEHIMTPGQSGGTQTCKPWHSRFESPLSYFIPLVEREEKHFFFKLCREKPSRLIFSELCRRGTQQAAEIRACQSGGLVWYASQSCPLIQVYMHVATAAGTGDFYHPSFSPSLWHSSAFVQRRAIRGSDSALWREW